jgi:hypothetical protein
LPFGRACPRNEELYCSVSQHLVRIFGPLGRHIEAWHPIDVLPLGAQGLTAGCQHAHRRRAAHETLSRGGRGLDDVFAIVEHDQ